MASLIDKTLDALYEAELMEHRGKPGMKTNSGNNWKKYVPLTAERKKYKAAKN